MIDAKQIRRSFGEYIRLNREKKNLSQAGLASLVKRDRQQIYRIENGLSGTTRETAASLAKALDLDKEDALERAGFSVPKKTTIYGKTESVEELVNKLRGMGFNIHFEGNLSDFTEDDLQDFIEEIEIRLIVKSQKKR